MFMIDRERIEIAIFPLLTEFILREHFDADDDLEELIEHIEAHLAQSLKDLPIAHTLKVERRIDRTASKIRMIAKKWISSDISFLVLGLLAMNLSIEGKLNNVDSGAIEAIYRDIFDLLAEVLEKPKDSALSLNLAIGFANDFKLEFIKERYFAELNFPIDATIACDC